MKKESVIRASNSNSAGTLSVGLGIISIPTSLFPFLGIFFGIVGIGFGISQYKLGKNKWAGWGIGLSILGIIISIILFIIAYKMQAANAAYQALS